MTRLTLKITRSSNSFGDQIVTAIITTPNGEEEFYSYSYQEGSWMTEAEIIEAVCNDGDIEPRQIRVVR
jgi:hypothetical protein